MPKFFVYSSDDDPYVPLEKGKEIEDNLDANLRLLNNAGHINSRSGYDKFEMLLEDIKKI